MSGDRRLHVLMLLDSSYPPLQGGGTEMQVRTLARGLRRRGHRVTVFAPVIPPAGDRMVARVDGVPAFRLPFPNWRFLGGVWLMVRLFLFLYSRRDRYDVWHVHSPRRLGAVAALLGSRLPKPQVVVKVASATELVTGTLSPKPNWIGRFQYFCLKRANAWQAISQRIAHGIAARGIPGERIAAVPNAVDVRRFRPAVQQAPGPVRFLFIGRLIRAKNLFRLLEAFAELLRTHPQAHLRIVGGGPQEAALKQHAAKLALGSSVEFTGHRSDVETLLSEADVGVLPSEVEGLSNTLLECMASGLPMVASRISGSEDLVRPGVNGWLFEPQDVQGLAQCLREAAEMSPEQRHELGAQARLMIENYASLDSVLDRILTLYRGKPLPIRTAAAAVSEGA
ncbi:glycosyltransferase family 4 protein [Lysobacter korlensis]|uniref:Glycosyltransferase family 4 protein n=1 Tax=Lysobacter korlensis TaxID=553636 RepID=A0ABV6RQ72_9GAMM